MKFKRILAAAMAAALTITTAGNVCLAAPAAENTAENSATVQAAMESAIQKTGKGVQFIDVPMVYDTPVVTVEEEIKSPITSAIKGSKYYKSKWEKYGSYYYYNQLSAKQKKLYNALNTQCLKFLTGDATCDNVMEDGMGHYLYHLDMIDYSALDLSLKSATDVMRLFKYSTPQYFFLSTYMYIDERSGMLCLFVYKDFITPEAREAAIDKMNETVDAWDEEISNLDYDEEKVRKIHDLICERVSYNNSAYDNNFANDENEYSQSIYSVFGWDQKKTVCAGYSQAFAFLANKYGIDSVSVSSEDHQWNAVRVYDQWYTIDLTWDDDPYQDGSIPVIYFFFCRSDKKIAALLNKIDAGNNESHTAESFYGKKLPKCVKDTGSTQTMPGEFFEPDYRAKAVTITVNKYSKKVSLKSKTKKATIYYTTDGTAPDPASTKSNLYTGAFKVKKGQVIRAIAVKSGYEDSKITKKKVKF